MRPLGDRAILIDLRNGPEEQTQQRVQAACMRLTESSVTGVIEVVPGFATVAVHYDPMVVSRANGGRADPYHSLATLLESILQDLDTFEPPPTRLVEIPVCYGGDLGPDLEAVARHGGIAADEVAAIHANGEYGVRMMGFAPGFAYLDGLDPRIATPRLSTPRVAVPARSVGIGGSHTGIYPVVSPGGWNIIGRTPLTLFDPFRDPPTLLRMSDRVRFLPLSRDEYDAMVERRP